MVLNLYATKYRVTVHTEQDGLAAIKEFEVKSFMEAEYIALCVWRGEYWDRGDVVSVHTQVYCETHGWVSAQMGACIVCMEHLYDVPERMYDVSFA